MVAVMLTESEFDWREHAICKFADDRIFFAEGYGSIYTKARKYCSKCPVVIDCLLDAIEDPDNLGMWGCMSPDERRIVVDRMDDGLSFRKAVESIWNRERRRFNGNIVPKKSVWKDWDA